jgi:peptide/nickel transport system substrate-binding protein
MKRRGLRVGLAAVLAVGAMTIAGCTAGGPAVEEPSGTEPQALRMAIETPPPGGWDPTVWGWDGYTPIQEAAYDGLIRSTTDGLVPGLATSWEWASPTEFHMDLREGVEFVDGEKFTAEAVKANIERFRDAGGRFSAWLAPIAEIDTPSESEVVLHMNGILPDLEVLLSQNAGLMISPAAIANPDVLTTAPQGVSGYLLDTDASTPDVKYVFEKNPDYWDAEGTHFDEVVFEIQTDRNASFNALLAGQLDLVWGLAEGLEMAESSGLNVFAPAGFLVMMQVGDYMGTQVEALADVRVRQAMNYAIDREALTEHVIPGEPMHQMFTSNTEAFVPALSDAYPYDPDRARDLLVDAGYADGVTLPILTTPDYTALVSAIASTYEEVGITLDIRTLELQDYIAELVAANAPISLGRASSQSTYADITMYLTANGARNPFKNELPEVAALYESLSSFSNDERGPVYQEIATVVSEEAIAVPILLESMFYYYDSSVTDLGVPDGYIYPTLYELRPAK